MSAAVRHAALAALLPLLAQAAPPQTVYRCGPDGRVYSQTPCADGKPVTVDDPRSGEQQKTAREVANRDAEHARKLADERRQREDAAKDQVAAGFRTAPASALAASAPPRKTKSRKAKAAAGDEAASPVMIVPAPKPTARR
ncbi:MAG TPA: hypothetical protein PKB14_12475 [Rubrivivax sp.]|nr:hypothetical protein [Rubrivivax sp.]